MSDVNTSLNEASQPAPLSHAGAALCASCGVVGEFDLPADEGQFEIACYECDHVYEIEAKEAIQTAITRNITPEPTTDSASDLASDSGSIQCLECGTHITLTSDEMQDEAFTPSCPTCNTHNQDNDDEDHQHGNPEDDIDLTIPTRFNSPADIAASYGAPAKNRTSIILVSILSFGFIVTAAMIALGLYFLTLRSDSDVTRYIEANILQIAPAAFEVQSASYELSETDIGKSLLVTISITNSGQTEGTPSEMKITLIDAQNQALVTWPLDTAGQIIGPGDTTQLYTRLFEPPANFANLRVFVR